MQKLAGVFARVQTARGILKKIAQIEQSHNEYFLLLSPRCFFNYWATFLDINNGFLFLDTLVEHMRTKKKAKRWGCWNCLSSEGKAWVGIFDGYTFSAQT